jgi:hypothetical protein
MPETFFQWLGIEKKRDPLALQWIALFDRRYALRHEIECRMGPGAMRRLPRGFGPIRS